MKRIYTFGGLPERRNLTVADLRQKKRSRGSLPLTQVTARCSDTARACCEAGIDIIVSADEKYKVVRHGAPENFISVHLPIPSYPTSEDALRAAVKIAAEGADAVITSASIRSIATIAAEGIATIGHVGLVPRKSTLSGGMRVVGKTEIEVNEVVEHAKRLEDAGAFAVEIECASNVVTNRINDETDLVTISIGSGGEADVIFLFMEDICGETEWRPRHAKAYDDLKSAYDEIFDRRVRALNAFKDDVRDGRYPGNRRTFQVSPASATES